MDYYVLELRARGNKTLDLVGTTYDTNKEVVPSVFYAGKSLEGQLKTPFTVILNDRLTVYNKTIPDRVPIDTDGTGSILFVSPAVEETFRKLKLPVEFYDVHVKGKKLEITDYKIANIIGRINCVDKEKSKLKYLDPSTIQIYYELVLDRSEIPADTDIFLLGEDCTMNIIVSKRLKTAVEDAKLTGFDFVKPEEYKTFRT